MDDQRIEDQIEALEQRRSALRAAEGAGRAPEGVQEQLEELGVELDRLWDLLRQRRALRSAGGDPAAASERSGDTVERYWQ